MLGLSVPIVHGLARLFSYVNSSLGLKLTGSMPLNCLDDARLVIWPDADSAGDKHSSKVTGGCWVELQCREHCWPLA
eukprot:1714633-Heterocapsa_arctica.AAC.1